jgi:RNA polymerase sigma factor (sigma-70 family)
MAVRPARDALRVAVACEQSLVVDAVRAALASRRVDIVALHWPGHVPVARPRVHGPRPAAHVGLLISDLDTHERLSAARLLVGRVDVPWLVITSAVPGPTWGAVLEAGARAVRGSGTSLDDILDALADVRDGGSVPATVQERLTAEWSELRSRRDKVAGGLQSLTPREREVLRLLYAGEPVARIADLLEVSRATVRSQVKAVLRKLDVNSQLGAVAVVGDMATFAGAPGDELLSTL